MNIGFHGEFVNKTFMFFGAPCNTNTILSTSVKNTSVYSWEGIAAMHINTTTLYNCVDIIHHLSQSPTKALFKKWSSRTFFLLTPKSKIP